MSGMDLVLPPQVGRALEYLAEAKLSLPPRLRGSAIRRRRERWEIVGGLTEDERSTTATMTRAVDRVLSPAGDGDVERALLPLLVAFPAQRMSDEMAAARVAVYAEAVRGLPAWAVREAVMAYVRGEVKRKAHDFAPTPPEVAIEARERLKPYQELRHQLRKVEEAEVIPVVDEAALEKRRSRVAEIMAGVGRAGK